MRERVETLVWRLAPIGVVALLWYVWAWLVAKWVADRYVAWVLGWVFGWFETNMERLVADPPTLNDFYAFTMAFVAGYLALFMVVFAPVLVVAFRVLRSTYNALLLDEEAHGPRPPLLKRDWFSLAWTMLVLAWALWMGFSVLEFPSGWALLVWFAFLSLVFELPDRIFQFAEWRGWLSPRP